MAFAKFSDTTTAPVFGETVSVVSEFDTEETPVWRHVPSIAKQPSVRLRPPAKDEVAVDSEEMPPLVRRSLAVEMPPVKDDVADEVLRMMPPVTVRPALDESPTVSTPPANVDVAVVVLVIEPVVSVPDVSDEKIPEAARTTDAMRLVDVALVNVMLVKVEVADEVAEIAPAVRLPTEVDEVRRCRMYAESA